MHVCLMMLTRIYCDLDVRDVKDMNLCSAIQSVLSHIRLLKGKLSFKMVFGCLSHEKYFSFISEYIDLALLYHNQKQFPATQTKSSVGAGKIDKG